MKTVFKNFKGTSDKIGQIFNLNFYDTTSKNQRESSRTKDTNSNFNKGELFNKTSQGAFSVVGGGSCSQILTMQRSLFHRCYWSTRSVPQRNLGSQDIWHSRHHHASFHRAAILCGDERMLIKKLINTTATLVMCVKEKVKCCDVLESDQQGLFQPGGQRVLPQHEATERSEPSDRAKEEGPRQIDQQI